jgi:peptide deformylase
MELVRYDDPVLSTPTKEFDFANPPFDPIEFASELVHFMYETGAVGLASNQVGVPYRIFAMRGSPENFVFFNPRLLTFSAEDLKFNEACVTYPHLVVPIRRPLHIRLRFALPNSHVDTAQYTGITARVIQHELMHLDGKVFFEGLVNRITLDRAIKNAHEVDYSGIGLMKYIRK